jgi:hypothetical protein
MENGIPGPDEGFDIIVNGVRRTYSDTSEGAYEAANYLKAKNPGDEVTIFVRSDKTTVTVETRGVLSS